jgi:hypothetical protein
MDVLMGMRSTHQGSGVDYCVPIVLRNNGMDILMGVPSSHEVLLVDIRLECFRFACWRV